jgi:hypothetical protein
MLLIYSENALLICRPGTGKMQKKKKKNATEILA